MGKQNKMVAYCSYCHDPIWEGQGMIKVEEDYFHFDKINPLQNCYFPEDNESEE